MPTRTFHVVTQRRWMADELTEALTPAGWSVRAHNGLSALPPEVGHDPAHVLWAPGAFAAREIVHGNPLRLAAPGPGWLPALEWGLTGRRVTVITAGEASEDPLEGFWKLAESKSDRFPATWRTAEELRNDLAAARVPGGAILHHSDRRLRLSWEFRSVVCRGRVTATSCYLDSFGRDRAHPDFAEPPSPVQRSARSAARYFSDQIEKNHPAGPAYTLDIGWHLDSNAFVVIEANPMWCSAWYSCDLVAFAEAVAAAQGSEVPDRFVWRPDPVLAERARMSRPLTPARSREVLHQ